MSYKNLSLYLAFKTISEVLKIFFKDKINVAGFFFLQMLTL